MTLRYQMNLYSFSEIYTDDSCHRCLAQDRCRDYGEMLQIYRSAAIEEDMIRKYNYPFYFSHILGHEAGKISSEELASLL